MRLQPCASLFSLFFLFFFFFFPFFVCFFSLKAQSFKHFSLEPGLGLERERDARSQLSPGVTWRLRHFP